MTSNAYASRRGGGGGEGVLILRATTVLKNQGATAAFWKNKNQWKSALCTIDVTYSRVSEKKVKYS